MRRQQTGFLKPSASPLAAATTLCLLLAACGPGGADWRQTQAAPQPSSEETGYQRPPQLVSAERMADGGVMLKGVSDPQVEVRLSSPDGVAYGATVRDNGAWSVTVPPAPGVREFGVAENLSGRMVQGEGYVAVLPGPGPAVALLRSGGGTVVPGPGSVAPRISAVDFDASGAAVISGQAAPATALRLLVDNAASANVHVGGTGRFAISVPAPLKPGPHDIQVESSAGSDHTKIDVGQVQSIVGLPYHGQRLSTGWRIDWVTAGGGVQTTLIIDPTEP